MMTYEMKSKYLYTLKDLVSKNDAEQYSDDIYSNVVSIDIVHSLRLGWESGFPESKAFEDAIASKEVTHLWYNLLVPNYLNSIIAFCDIDYDFESVSDYDITLEDNKMFNKVFGEFFRLFIKILMSTYDRYSKLIKIYEQNKDNLLNKIESSVINKSSFNETPQATVSDPFDTKYANNTTVSENISSTDAGTIMSRIREIDDNIRNLYEDWLDEFDTLFIPNMED